MSVVLAAALLATTRVLIPVAINGQMPGAHGSRWTTELIGRNTHTSYVKVSRETPTRPCAITCPRTPADPQSTFTPVLGGMLTGPGVFLYVDDPADRVLFTLRIKDVSRQAQTAGTEIPVVREADTFTGTMHILDVPLDARFRQTLRIYDWNGPANRSARVRIYRDDENVPVVDAELMLGPVLFTEIDPVYPDAPGYLQMGDFLANWPQLAGATRARLEIEPASPGLRFWAFVSVTNDETQHVTTILPAR